LGGTYAMVIGYSKCWVYPCRDGVTA
jgi:hypothetical protein